MVYAHKKLKNTTINQSKYIITFPIITDEISFGVVCSPQSTKQTKSHQPIIIRLQCLEVLLDSSEHSLQQTFIEKKVKPSIT